MKKILIASALIASLTACSNAEPEEPIEVLDATCEKVQTFEQGDMIVKCPITEQLVDAQSNAADSKFVQGGDGEANVIELAKDPEHIYVNVIPAGAYEWAEKTQYRVLVKEPVFEEGKLWSVSVIAD